ncbi:ABC transporter permease [Flaviflexus salsibiostraticola]|nr:ABC transporter permease [Flaviflexus salsibiostraticola]
MILFFASFLVYGLTVHSGDPLADLREQNDANRQNRIDQRVAQMRLNDPWIVRYGDWLRGILGCVRLQCDFGENRSGQDVNALLANAAESTIRLVLLATILGILVGVFFGVMAAIRQYSGFDYSVTFIAFVFYSLPAFVFAVLLKEFGAIRFNNWLAEPAFNTVFIVLVAGIFAVFVQAIIAGPMKNRIISGAVAFAAAAAVFVILDVTDWVDNPIAGLWMPITTGIAAAVMFTALLSSITNRRAIFSALGSAGAMVLLVVIFAERLEQPTWTFLIVLLLAGVALAVVISQVFGGYAKRSITWASIWTVVSVGFAVLVDYLARNWSDYVELVRGRPISTIGSMSPNFRGADDFWLSLLDTSTHLILPTLSLTLMSVASYTRYTRSSMLEVLGQDYVRTARAKGLPEHTVMTRHAFRNALLPITTIVAFDFASLIGGAVITEKVFGWKGMGELFETGLRNVDPDPVMAFFIVTGGIAVLMNMLADIMYAYIDPRIRR